MNTNKILLITKITLLTFALLSFTVSYASEVTGTLTSSGISSPVISGSVTGSISGTVVGGTSGGGSSISGTVIGVAANGPIAGGGGGGGNANTNVPPSNVSGSASEVSSTQNSVDDSLNRAGLQTFANAFPNEDIVATELAQGDVSALTDGQIASNQNTNQLAAVATSGIGLNRWIWWMFFVILLLIVGYYVYTRNEKRRSIR